MTARPGLTWKRITKGDFWEALEALPPARRGLKGFADSFLLGEPQDHVVVVTDRAHELPRYSAFVEIGGRFYTSNEPLTVLEFGALVPADVAPNDAEADGDALVKLAESVVYAADHKLGLHQQIVDQARAVLKAPPQS